MNVDKLVKMIRKTEKVLIDKNITTEPIEFNDEVINFIKEASPESLYLDTFNTIKMHTQCLAASIDDGRVYWKYMQDGRMIGISGYHHRTWDPENVIWAGWYFVEQDASKFIKMAVLFDLFKKIIVENEAYEKCYIETFSDREESNIIKIYESMEFVKCATLPDFYGEKQDMTIVYFDVAAARKKLELSYQQELAGASTTY